MTTPDAFIVTEGSTGSFVATDSITTGLTTSHYQYVKLAFGQDGTATLVDTASGKHIPVQLYSGGSAISSTSNRLDVNLASSGITLNTGLGGTFGNFEHVGVEGIPASVIPVMVSGSTAIGGAIAVKGVGGLAGSDNFLFVSGFEGATALGITNATPLDIRKLTASFAGATFTGDVIGVTGAVQVSSTDLDIRNLTATHTSGVLVGDIVGITGTVGIQSGAIIGITNATPVNTRTLASTFAAGAFTGDLVGVTGELKTTLRGLSFGHHVSADGLTAATLTDGVVAKGISGAFPVNTFIRGIDSVNGLPAGIPIGACGDALRVHVTNAGVSIAATFNSNIGMFNAVKPFLAVSGSSFHHQAVLVEGTAGGVPVGITWALRTHVGVTTETPLEVKISNTHGISGFYSGGAAGTYAGDFIGVTGAVFVGNVVGITNATPLGVRPLSAGYTGVGPHGIPGGTQGTLSGDIVGVTGAVEIYAPGITGVNAMQVQGRADGATITPIPIIGTLKTDASSAVFGAIGVTFAQSATHVAKQTVIGGSSADTLRTLVHGVSTGKGGATAQAIALKKTADGDYAVKVAIEDATLTATISDTNLKISDTTIPTTSAVPVQGSAAGKLGVFVTGKGGTTDPWPLMVSGHKVILDETSGAPIGITFADLGVTFDNDRHVQGVSAGLTDIALNTRGITHYIHGLSAEVQAIHEQEGIAQAIAAIGAVDANGTLVSNAKSILDFLDNTLAPTIDATNKDIAVSVAAPTVVVTDQVVANPTTATAFTNAATLKSGVRIKLPSTETGGNVFVGSGGVSSSTGFLLTPGDDVFIEINSLTNISVISTSSNVTVYAIGS